MSTSPRLEEWNIDPSRSTLGFTLRHIVVHQIRGKFGRWGGRVVVDPASPALASVSVWIDLGSVDTGETERDDHIRSPEFFDAARLPRATFTSTALRTEASPHPILVGRLDLHESQGEIEVEITEQSPPWTESGAERRRLTARATVDRRAFGLRWNQDLDVGGVVVGDKVDIQAQVELVRAL